MSSKKKRGHQKLNVKHLAVREHILGARKPKYKPPAIEFDAETRETFQMVADHDNAIVSVSEPLKSILNAQLLSDQMSAFQALARANFGALSSDLTSRLFTATFRLFYSCSKHEALFPVLSKVVNAVALNAEQRTRGVEVEQWLEHLRTSTSLTELAAVEFVFKCSALLSSVEPYLSTLAELFALLLRISVVGGSSSMVGVMEASKNSRTIMKQAYASLLSREMIPIVRRVVQEEANTSLERGEPGPFEELVHSLHDVLTVSHIEKSCPNRVAMTLLHILSFAGRSTDELREFIFYTFMCHYDDHKEDFPLPSHMRDSPLCIWLYGSNRSATSTADRKPLPLVAGEPMRAYWQFSQLAMLSAILTGTDMELLMASPLPSYTKCSVAQRSNIFELSFDLIAAASRIANSPARLHAIQTLDMWVCLAVKLLGPKSKIKPSDSQLAFIDEALSKTDDILAQNWEHRFRPIPAALKVVFRNYLKMLEMQRGAIDLKDTGSVFWREYVRKIMELDFQRKGKYMMLSVLSQRIGALPLLKFEPSLMHDLFESARDLRVRGVSSTFLFQMVRAAQKELKNNAVETRKLWVAELVAGLHSPDKMVQRGITAELLPKLLDFDKGAFPALLASLDDHASASAAEDEQKSEGGVKRQHADREREEATLRALISVLRIGRRSGVIDGEVLGQWLDADNNADASSRHSGHAEALRSGLLHNNAEIRIMTLEILCENNRLSEVPTAAEIEMLKGVLPYHMKIQTNGVRDKFVHLVQRFLLRILCSCRKVVADFEAFQSRSKAFEEAEKQKKSGQAPSSDKAAVKEDVFVTRDDLANHSELQPIIKCLNFLEWMESFLMAQLYPGAPYERMVVVLELIRIHVELFTDEEPRQEINEGGDTEEAAYSVIYRFKFVHSERLTRALLTTLGDSWERIRLLSAYILERLPAPLAGFETLSKLWPWIVRGVSLSRSLRGAESESGALLLRVLHMKFVSELRWQLPFRELCALDLTDESFHSLPQAIRDAHKTDGDGVPQRSMSPAEAEVSFLEQFSAVFEDAVRSVESSTQPLHKRFDDSRHRIHGLLTFFGSILRTMDYSRVVSDDGLRSRVSASLSRFLGALFQFSVPILAMHVEDTSFVGATGNAVSIKGIDCRGHVMLEGVDGGDEAADDGVERQLTVMSWVALKEICLSLAALVCELPLSEGVDDEQKTPTADLLPEAARGVLSRDQVKQIGDFLISVLISSKHNGVIDKSHEALLSCCERLLNSKSVSLSSLVDDWLSALLARVRGDKNAAKNGAVTWIRRSAGLPFCFLAVVQAEPRPRQLVFLPKVMRTLLDTIAAQRSSSVAAPSGDSWKREVHALNILKMLVGDASLSVEVVPFIAEAMVAAIQGFSSPVWAVRNSSLLAYSALLGRSVGTAKLKPLTTSQTAVDGSTGDGGERQNFNGITGAAFFNQFSSLHSFFLGELTDAVEQVKCERELRSKATKSADAFSSAIHPSLYPVLLLLSKLIPTANEETFGGLRAFVPLIRKCAAHSHYMGRFMAARALIPLVPPSSIPSVVEELLTSLPTSRQELLSVGHNFLHGTSLQILHLLRELRRNRDIEKTPATLSKLVSLFQSRFECLVGTTVKTRAVKSDAIVEILLEACRELTTLSGTDCTGTRLFRKFSIEACARFSQQQASTSTDSTEAEAEQSVNIGGLRLQERAAELLLDLLFASDSRSLISSPVTDVVLALLFGAEFESPRRAIYESIVAFCRRDLTRFETLVDTTKLSQTLCASILSLKKTPPASDATASSSSSSPSPKSPSALQPLHLTPEGLAASHCALQLELLTIIYSETSPLPLESLSDLFEFVCALCSLSTSPRAVQVQSVHFLSRLLKSNPPLRTPERCQAWFTLVDSFSQDEQPPDLRNASASAIASSTLLLTRSPAVDDRFQFGVWCTLIRILQDCEEVIREHAAQVTCDVLSQCDVDSISSAIRAPLMPSKALELAFEFVSHKFGSSDDDRLVKFLWKNQLASACDEAEVLEANSERRDEEPFALFAPEKANDFFEPIVLARLQSQAIIRWFSTLPPSRHAPHRALACDMFAQSSRALTRVTSASIRAKSGVQQEVTGSSSNPHKVMSLEQESDLHRVSSLAHLAVETSSKCLLLCTRISSGEELSFLR